MNSKLKIHRNTIIFFIATLAFGCVASKAQAAETAQPPHLFPPHAVMQSGDYQAFFTENCEALKTCRDPDKCAEALFNLVFIRCYPKSPYYDPREGLKYIDDLTAAVPQSPYASEARVWRDLIKGILKKRTVKRPVAVVRGETSKEAEEPQQEPQQLQEDSSQEREVTADRQRMEDEIRAKNEIIEKLNKQLERSRQIDIEMGQKERGLLQ